MITTGPLNAKRHWRRKGWRHLSLILHGYERYIALLINFFIHYLEETKEAGGQQRKWWHAPERARYKKATRRRVACPYRGP